MQRLAHGNQCALLGRVFDRPCLAAISAASQQVLFGPVVIDGVPAGTVVLEISGAETDEDFIAPGPNAMIRWPATEPARLGIDLHMCSAGRRRLRRAEGNFAVNTNAASASTTKRCHCDEAAALRHNLIAKDVNQQPTAVDDEQQTEEIHSLVLSRNIQPTSAIKLGSG